MNKTSKDKKYKPEIALKGIPASSGIAFGPVFFFSEPTFSPELRVVSRKRVIHEINRFKRAIENSRNYLKRIYDQTVKYYGEEFTEVLQTQVDILDDKIFLEEVEQLIREKQFDAAYATFKIFRNKKEHFLKLANEYFRDRAFDVQNLKQLILKNLLGKKFEVRIIERSIIVADNLSPAETIRLHHKNILGFCTNVGGKNSHTAIIARSLGVPAVVGTEVITNIAKTGDQIVIDGNSGVITVNPSEQTIDTFKQKQQKFIVVEKELLKNADEPAETVDGKRIEIFANIEFIEEMDQVHNSGAEGIGLYRTEGLFLGDNGLPTEEQQYQNYKKIAESMGSKTVVIRTLDVGGDKLLPELVSTPERNPFLGWRAIRFCLDHKEIFIPQLKAILRANKAGNIRLLLPMVSSLEEIYGFREVLDETKSILEREKRRFNPDIKIGMMVEIPSAALLAHAFAELVDFFSIGTNDLIQYTLAVDRANEKISRLYNHYHPTLLMLIKNVIETSKAMNIPTSMCGEMGGDPLAIPLLIGMGLEHISAAHSVIPEIKNVIRHLSLDQCVSLYEDARNLKTATEIRKLAEDFYFSIFKEKSNGRNNNKNSFVKRGIDASIR